MTSEWRDGAAARYPVLLWWLEDDATLDSVIKDRLDADSEIFVSSATMREVGIKQALGKFTGE